MQFTFDAFKKSEKIKSFLELRNLAIRPNNKFVHSIGYQIAVKGLVIGERPQKQVPSKLIR